MHFIFTLFDSDLDGEITSKDISDFMSNVLSCPKMEDGSPMNPTAQLPALGR